LLEAVAVERATEPLATDATVEGLAAVLAQVGHLRAPMIPGMILPSSQEPVTAGLGAGQDFQDGPARVVRGKQGSRAKIAP
jgi:hypothetical protein